MSYTRLLEVLKGGPTSGNWAHMGRPGKRGGSQPGGGHGTLGIGSWTSPDEKIDTLSSIRMMSEAGRGGYKYADHSTMKKYYNMADNCGVKFDCGALTHYTSSAYVDINSHLRGGGKPTEVMNEMDEAFDKGPRVPAKTIVKRNIYGDKLFNELSEGTVFQDDGYVSTTIDKHNSVVSAGYQLEIRVPKGAKGLYLAQISHYGSEQELLLPRGSQFKVIKKHRNRAILELIPQ